MILLSEAGATLEKHAVSRKESWPVIRQAYTENTEIVIALPLFVENILGLLLEFLETLPVKDKDTRVSFILQGGFAEASQLECGKTFLEKLPDYLGVSYGGTLIKGDNFGIRVAKAEEAKKITKPYKEMGKSFAGNNGFQQKIVKKFAGSDYLSLPNRALCSLLFKTLAKKKFAEISMEWGCTVPLNDRPWEQ